LAALSRAKAGIAAQIRQSQFAATHGEPSACSEPAGSFGHDSTAADSA